MLKRILATATIVGAIPAVANASWLLNTWAKSGGGNIVVRNGAAQNSFKGSVFKTYTTSSNVNVAVNANTGFTIKNVTVDGATVASSGTTYSASVTPGATHSVYATFKASSIAVSASAGLGGAVTPTGVNGILYGQVVKLPIKFQVTPNAGYAVDTITINGVDSSKYVVTTPAKAPKTRIVTINPGHTFTAPVSVAATFVGSAVNAGANQTVTVNSTVTLFGTKTGTPAFTNWSSMNFPRVPLANGTTLTPSFVPTAPGTYSFRLVSDGNVSVTNVYVVDSKLQAVKNQCVNCHTENGVGAGVYAAYSTGSHRNLVSALFPTANTCASCHVGADAGAHPGQVSCQSCHSSSVAAPTANYLKSAHFQDPYGEMVVKCQDCHNPHNPTAVTYATCDTCHVPGTQYSVYKDAAKTTLKKLHGNENLVVTSKTGSTSKGWYSGNRYVFSNTTTSFVTAADACSNCHGHNNTINGEYADNYHSANNRWKSSSSRVWKYQGYSTAATPAQVSTDGCVRCHSTTGFVNFVTSNFTNLKAWGFQEAGYTNANTAAAASNTNKSAEAVTCRACHSDAEGTIRTVAAAQAFYNMTTVPFGKINSAMVQYKDYKNSNVCIPCHMGRNGANDGKSIDTIATKFAAFANVTSLTVVNQKVDPSSIPHGVQQAGVLDAKLGYLFGQTFTNGNNSHSTIGVPGGDKATNTTSGPCATCHMDNALGHRNHTFDVVINGQVPAVCATCHGPNFSSANIDDAQVQFNDSVQALAEIMADEKLNFLGVPIFQVTATTTNGVTTYSYKWANTGAGPGKNSAGNKYNFAGKAADLQKVLGAVYNYNLLMNDLGAFAHNPAYAKWLINQSINAVRATGATVSGVTTTATTSAADAISKISSGRIAAADLSAASEYLNADGHYAANGTYKVQYVTSTARCTDCHNPNETSDQAAARVAWAESAHGSLAGTAWMPASSHLWRNAGDAKDFSVSIPVNDCQRCHTTDGFAQFADSKFTNINPVATAADAATNSTLSCNACHSNGTDFSRRAVLSVAGTAYGDGKSPNSTRGIGVATFYNISTVDKVSKLTVKARIAVNFPDVGESNMCNSCHSARLGGSALVAAVNNGLSLSNSGFQNSHYLGASGLMYMKAGFINFTSASAVLVAGTTTTTYGKALNSSLDLTGGVTSTHRNLGTVAINNDSHNAAKFVAGYLDSNGPCVTCHMKGYGAGADRAGKGHSLEVNADAYNQVCINCHTSEGSAAGPVALTSANFLTNFVEPNKEAFQNSLNLATTLLLSKYNIKYDSATYPYFYDIAKDATGKTAVTDWTRSGALSNAAALKLEGACLNINLLSREPAAFVHARTYVRRLVYDTIDFLDDGVMNLSVATSAHTVDPTNFTAGTKAYTDSTLGTFAASTTEGMLYLKSWNRTDGTWTASEHP